MITATLVKVFIDGTKEVDTLIQDDTSLDVVELQTRHFHCMKRYRSKEGSWIEWEQMWRDGDESTRLISLKLIINDVVIQEVYWPSWPATDYVTIQH